MNVNEFREDLLEQIRFAFSADGTSDREAFLSCVSEMLVEAEEIDDAITFLPFEGIGTNRRKIQIDGYTFNELDDYLAIYAIADLNYGELETLTGTEANRYFSRAKAFIEDASLIIKNAEESAPAYGLAKIGRAHV